MAKITKTYTFTAEEALALAKFYGYTEKVVDQTLLDENGNVPRVPAVNDDGTPRYEIDVEWAEDGVTVVSETPHLVDGEPVQIMEPTDVYIANTISPVEYLSGNFDEHVKPWFVALAKSEADKAQKQAEHQAAEATRAAVQMIEDSVGAKIATVIE